MEHCLKISSFGLEVGEKKRSI